MKITGTRTQIVELPADEPLANAPENPNGKRPIVTLTGDGLQVRGNTYIADCVEATIGATEAMPLSFCRTAGSSWSCLGV